MKRVNTLYDNKNKSIPGTPECFGYLLQELCTKKWNELAQGDKIKRLSKEFNITYNGARKWFYGSNKPDDIKTFMNIADFFQVSLDYLVGKDTEPTRTTQFIHDYTGLSSEAIKYIHDLTNEKSSTLNQFFANKSDLDMILDEIVKCNAHAERIEAIKQTNESILSDIEWNNAMAPGLDKSIENVTIFNKAMNNMENEIAMNKNAIIGCKGIIFELKQKIRDNFENILKNLIIDITEE